MVTAPSAVVLCAVASVRARDLCDVIYYVYVVVDRLVAVSILWTFVRASIWASEYGALLCYAKKRLLPGGHRDEVAWNAHIDRSISCWRSCG